MAFNDTQLHIAKIGIIGLQVQFITTTLQHTLKSTVGKLL